MKRNVDINGLGPTVAEEDMTTASHAYTEESIHVRKPNLGMVRINEGDAWYALFDTLGN